mmetsp:Transcript_18150/g.33169  ORF Transcript_18150/g.33169 Transcript_18150/m.33169 type:complete len:222 (+) Transcript_18150:1510-2175(+)
MAETQRHSDMAALLCRATCAGLKDGFLMIRLSRFKTRSETRSRSYSISLFTNAVSPTTRLAVSQSLFSRSRMHTPSMVSLTKGGGFRNVRISMMSALFSALSDCSAVSKAGSTDSKSAFASSLSWSSAMALTLTSDSSSITASLTLSASLCSAVTWTSSFCAASVFCSSTGCMAFSSLRILSITPLVSLSLSRPVSRRSRSKAISWRRDTSKRTYWSMSTR